MELSTEAPAGSPPVPTGSAEFAAWAAPSLLAMTRLTRRLVPAAEVDDVVQNSLLRAWLKRDSYDPSRGSATTWLLAIVADQAHSTRRSLFRRSRVVDSFAELPDNAGEAGRTPRDVELDDAIDRLPRRQRLAVQLRYFVGLSVEETAQVMGCATGTVKSTLFDARSRLRKSLGEDDAH